MTNPAHRDLYARVGLEAIPHILSLVDRNALSPTYGCFDRSYWHYRTAAFPSGMYQEFVLPLALVFTYPFPGGETYHEQPRLRELVEAGIRFALRSSHRDGSCDDYFPYEKAMGAAAFSLYACTESYLILGMDEADLVGFFRKRARWLLGREESGTLSNHHALVVLALQNVFEITGESIFREGAQRRLNLLLEWQTEEGWFPEYEGCDPGYLTATIDFLAKYSRKSRNQSVLEPLKRAVRFAANFMHPDGSYGGEYGSRNTALYFPHGFEIMAEVLPEAAETADCYLEGIRKDRRVHLDDDRLCAHLSYNHLQAFLEFSGRKPGEYEPKAVGNRYWEGAGIYLFRDAKRHAVVSVAKGGVIRLYSDDELAYADSGLIARTAGGRTFVSHHVDRYEVDLIENGIRVAGSMGLCRFKLPTPISQAIFHMGMLTLGRWASDLVRALLQRLLIVGKKTAPMRFSRTFSFEGRAFIVDEIWLESRGRPTDRIVAMHAGTDHTSIYVAVSNSYQRACLDPWADYSEHLESLNGTGHVRIERVIE